MQQDAEPLGARGFLLHLASQGLGGWIAGCAGPAGFVAGSAIEYFGPKIAARWLGWFRKAGTPDGVAALEGLANVPRDEALREARAAIERDAPPEATAEDKRVAADYLAALPQALSHSMVQDPTTGQSTCTAQLLPRSEGEVLRLLPTVVPPFQAPADLPGTHYRLLDLLGTGSFGAVYRAVSRYEQYREPVAIKFCLDPRIKGTLERERKLLDRLIASGGGGAWSRHIVRLYGHYLDGSDVPPFLVYECVTGGDLVEHLHRHRMASGRPFSEAEALSLVRQMAEGLAFAHARGLVHRDLKPSNVLLDGGVMKLTDFGIGAAVDAGIDTDATATAQAFVLRGSGTPLYMSDEQRKGEDADPRHDVYSLGVIWFQLLVGDVSRPMNHGWRSELQRRYGVPLRTLELIAGCVDWPDDRFPDGGALLRAIDAAAASAVSPAKRGTQPAEPQSPATDPPTAGGPFEYAAPKLWALYLLRSQLDTPAAMRQRGVEYGPSTRFQVVSTPNTAAGRGGRPAAGHVGVRYHPAVPGLRAEEKPVHVVRVGELLPVRSKVPSLPPPLGNPPSGGTRSAAELPPADVQVVSALYAQLQSIAADPGGAFVEQYRLNGHALTVSHTPGTKRTYPVTVRTPFKTFSFTYNNLPRLLPKAIAPLLAPGQSLPVFTWRQVPVRAGASAGVGRGGTQTRGNGGIAATADLADLRVALDEAMGRGDRGAAGAALDEMLRLRPGDPDLLDERAFLDFLGGQQEVPPGGGRGEEAPIGEHRLRFEGVIRGETNRHKDGRERLYVEVKKSDAAGFPHREGELVPVDLHVNGAVFPARVRTTESIVYIASALRTERKDVGLAHVLESAGLRKRDRVTIEVNGLQLRLYPAERTAHLAVRPSASQSERVTGGISDPSRTQRVTAVDLASRRVRLPRGSKHLFPPTRARVQVELRGTLLEASYEPRLGPDRERSGVLSFATDLSHLVRADEVLTVTRSEDGVLRLQ
jgi:serine/threonine protein kinase